MNQHNVPETPDMTPVRLKPTCMNMRHKLMYADIRHAQRGMVDDGSDTRVYWCAKTQEQLGPDGEDVAPSVCNASRGCFCGR